jgi:hypothetical protein
LTSQAVQVFPVGGAVRSSPAIWNGTLYIGPSATPMSAYSIDSTGQLSGPVSTTAHAMGYPSVTPIVSANGSGNGIVWVLERYDSLTTILRAYDATNLANELYDSQQNVDRDAVGPGTRFCTPLVFDGKVFVPTQTSLLVYSLL